MTSPSHGFVSLERAAAGLTTAVENRNALTWDEFMQRMSAHIDWMVLPRATELRCGPGVADWLKATLPTVKDSGSPFGVAQYSGIKIVETDDLPFGRYVVVDQYGMTMLEDEAPVRVSVAEWYLLSGARGA